MTALLRGPLQGEVIAPGKGLKLIVLPHPLLSQSIVVEAAAGSTLAELVELGRKIAGPQFRFRFVAGFNDGTWVPEGLWPRVRPKPGTVVVLRAVAGDFGDNSLLRTLLGAAVTIAGAAATLISPLLGAAITVGGQLAINALFPVAPPKLALSSSGSQTYSIEGGQNTADLYGAVTEIEGRHRYYPKLGADWYTEFVGADQYLIGLVIWGYGPKEVSSIKIGETPIESFDDVQIETRLGYPDDAPVTLYPSEVVQDDLSVDISVAAGPQLRTTAANIDAISLDLVAPQGIIRVAGNGAAQSYTVQIKAEYRAAGSADPWLALGTLTFAGRSANPIRQGLKLAVANGQYDVQITKTSADYAGSDQVSEEVVWSALRGIRNAPPVQFKKPVAHSALRIKATSQLSGVIDSLNGIVATHCTVFNGVDAWVDDTASSSPADLFRHVLQGPANARPKADSRINIANLQLWWQYCKDNGFKCNLVLDSTGVLPDVLSTIAATGRASVSRTDGLYDVIWDEPDAPIVQHFTPRNSHGFSSARAYVRAPHAFRVRFINEQAGYVQDERVVYDDGYNADGSDGLTAASLFESIEFPGVTDPDLIWRHARFHVAQARLRPEQYQLTTDFEWLVARRGDRVRVTHDVTLWGIGSGRVKSTAVAGADDSVRLDEPLTMEEGKAYSIRFRLADGTSLLRTVTTVAGEQTVLMLTGHGDLPAAGDLFMFGENGSESVVLRVSAIAPAADFAATLTLVDDAPAISTADQGAIPAFDSQITVPADPFTAAPINLGVAEAFEGVDGAAATGALFSWETVAGESPVAFQVEHRDDDGDGVYRDDGQVAMPGKAIFLAGLLQGHWSFRVRCVFADGSFSKWTELARVDITAGAGLTLPDVTNLVTSFKDSTSALTWDEVSYSKLDVRYEIRKGDDWTTALVIGVDIAHPPFTTYGDGTYWIAAKAQPLPGITIYSEHPASLVIAGSILVRNVVATLDEQANGWTGVITPDGAGEVDGTTVRTLVANEIVYYELDAGRIFDVGFLRRTRIEASWKAVGVPLADNVLTDPDFLANPDVLSAGSSRYVEAWPEISVAGEVASDVFAATDVFVAPDVFAGAAVFAAYQKFAPGEYLGRFFKLRMALRSNDASISAALVAFTVTADVEDRVDHLTDYALPAAATTINFTPDGTADAKPFKGGPGTATVPHYQVTWSETAGDLLEVTALSLSAITFKITNGGVAVARTINALFQGW